MNNLIVHNFLPALLLPTRITSKSATVIDHIYYYIGRNSKKNLKLISGNFFSDLSDHLPNFAILVNISNKPNMQDRPLIRLYNEKNKHTFQNALSQVNWQNILYLVDDVNICYNNFICEVKKCYESSFPLTRLSRRAYKDKKWFSKV